MKKIVYTILGVAFLVAGSVSCERSYLYPWPPDGARTPDDVWANRDFTLGVIDAVIADNLFSPMYSEVSGYGNFASASDEAEHSNPSGAVQQFTNGAWNPTNVPYVRYGGPWNDNYSKYTYPWANSYEAIRRLNAFLENVDNSALIDNPNDPSKAFERTYSKGFAYFLRAWFQFDIFRKYGCFPVIKKTLVIGDEDVFKAKNTLSECYQAILEDCDKAIELLPALWDNNNWGKANRAAAMALKSRLTLYYASPLYQGGDEAYATFGLDANSTGDVARWKTAAKAAHDMIEENVYYSLMPVTRFTAPYSQTGTYNNQLSIKIYTDQLEWIWGTHASGNYIWWDERYNLPAGVEGCYGYTNPTQEMVDAFEVVKNFGKANAIAEPFSWSNPAHAAEPYTNRDPRFYASINYNGAIWGMAANRQYPIDTYEGGVHRNPTNPNSTKTGYYMRKYLTDNFYKYVSGWYQTPTRSRGEFRLAEVILNYAEAMNEAYGPEGADPDGALRFGFSNALSAVNYIRARVKMPAIAAGLTKEAMREKIKHERRVELCFEGHRMYDLRRWKEGSKLGDPIHGVVITPTGFNAKGRPTGFTYKIEEVEKRVWRDCMYWWPLPYSEIVKYEGKLIQNPGWGN